MKKKIVHVIPHTHWDKEWYFTSSRSKMYLIDQVKEILSVLERDEEFTSFLLDAQTSLVTDYLTYYPEEKERLEAHIRNGRLIIGPWHTQTDQLVVAQESIVRNLYYGINDALSYGAAMRIGYAPDAFGQGGNMPQIYQQHQIEQTIFWRGISDDELKETEFMWEGIDGTKLLAIQMYFSYYYGSNIPENETVLSEYIEQTIDPLDKKATTNHLYFPNGGDQVPITRNLTSLVKKLNTADTEREYIISSPNNFIQALEKDINVDNLRTFKGELAEGQNSRVHKSIYSCRADLKQKNNALEAYLVNTLEPILSIYYQLLGTYPHREVEEIWKLLFENSAHDSIGGCNSDSTNQDIASRYKLGEDLAVNLLELHMRKLSQHINQNENYAFTIFNPLPYKKSGTFVTEMYLPETPFHLVDLNGKNVPYVVLESEDQTDYLLNQFAYLTPNLYRDVTLQKFIPEQISLTKVIVYVEDIPAVGYTQFYLRDGAAHTIEHQQSNNNAEYVIENDHLSVKIEEDKSITVINKKTNRTYPNQFIIEENGDDGDSYNYSVPREDFVITSEDAQVINIEVDRHHLIEKFRITYDFRLPANLEERAQKKCSVSTQVVLELELRKGEAFVRGEVQLDNQVDSHRLCLKVETNIESQKIIADGLYCAYESDFEHPKMQTWEQEGWAEAPISINPMQSYVALSDEEQTVALLSGGVREYETSLETKTTLKLTLFRTFGFMGKEDLVYRPGRASGEKIVATPDAQLHGAINARFAVVYSDRHFDESNIAMLAKEYLTTFPIYELTDFLNGRTIFPRNNPEEKSLPTSYQLFADEMTSGIVGAIKKSEKNEAFIVRMFNPFLRKNITLPQLLQKENAHPVLLDEQTLLEKKEKLAPAQLATFMIEQ